MSLLNEFLARSAQLPIVERRLASEAYAELVILQEHLSDWEILLSEMFGPAAKPAGAPPTARDLLLSGMLGSIRMEQSLYKREWGGVTVVALLWPWTNGMHITLKLGFFAGVGAPGKNVSTAR
jgi:hypothetical protein